jgi:hypothetical protein
MYTTPACELATAFATAAVHPPGPVTAQLPAPYGLNGFQGLGTTVAPSAFDLQVGPSLTCGPGMMPANWGAKAPRVPQPWGPDSRLLFPGGQVPKGDLAGFMTDPVTGIKYACSTQAMQLPQIPSDGDMYAGTQPCARGAANRQLEALTGVSALGNPRQCHREFLRPWVDALEGAVIPESILNQQVSAAQAANAAQQVFFTNRETPAGFVEGGPPAGYIGENYMLRVHEDTQTLNDYDGGGTSVLPDRPQHPDLGLLFSMVRDPTGFGGPLAPVVRVLRENKAAAPPRPVADALQDQGPFTGNGLTQPSSSSVRVAARLGSDTPLTRLAAPQFTTAEGTASVLQPEFSVGAFAARLMQDPGTASVMPTGLHGLGNDGRHNLAAAVDTHGRGLQGVNGGLHFTGLGGVAEDSNTVSGLAPGAVAASIRRGPGGVGPGEALRQTLGGVGGADGSQGVNPANQGLVAATSAGRRFDTPGAALRTDSGVAMETAYSGSAAVGGLASSAGLVADSTDRVAAFRQAYASDDPQGLGNTLAAATAGSVSRLPQDNGFATLRPGAGVADVDGLGAAVFLAPGAVAGPSGRRSGTMTAGMPSGRTSLGAMDGNGSTAPALTAAAQVTTAGAKRLAQTQAVSFRAVGDPGAGPADLGTALALGAATEGPMRGSVMATVGGRDNFSWDGPSSSFWMAPVVDGDRGDRSCVEQDCRLTSSSFLDAVVRSRYPTTYGPDLARVDAVPLAPTQTELLNADVLAVSAARSTTDAVRLEAMLQQEAVNRQRPAGARPATPIGAMCLDGYDTDAG